MHYNWQPLFLSFLVRSLLGNDQLASAGRIPSRTSLVVREDANPDMMDIPGLRVLAEYVCPNVANSVKRQTSGEPTVAVPKDQLQNILLQLQQVELTILALIQQYMADGGLDSTDPSGVFVGTNGDQVISVSSHSSTSMNLGSLSSAVGSILSALPTTNGSGACTYNISTTTLQSIITVTAPVTTVTRVSNSTNVAASSTAIPASTNLTDVAASSTTTSDSGVAASTSGGIFIQTSGSEAAPTTSDLVPPTYTGGTAPGTGSDSTSYTFNSQASKNVAVYFGQTPLTGGKSLAAQCADPNIDIVILAFVISTADGGQYPAVNFGAACGGQTTEMISKAPGLLSCPQLATDITTCQSKYGEKVMLSFGGATSQISFTTASSASAFATMMWNLFGPPGNVDVGLRPFGTVQIDGFDVDNEDNIAANWGTFASTLRTLYASHEAKTYYLASAPQCPFPDASNPQALILLCDFVWVQFYNNPECQIGVGADFTKSLNQWSSALELSTMAVKPRMYLGAQALSAAGSTAYVAIGNAEGMQAVASSVEKMGLPNFGESCFGMVLRGC